MLVLGALLQLAAVNYKIKADGGDLEMSLE